MNRHLRLLLVGALALLLLTCTVAAWAGPQGSKASAASVAAADGAPCDRVIGPAHDYCTRTPATRASTGSVNGATVAGPTAAATATMIPAALGGRAGLLVFATAAIAGAVGLVLTVERRTR